MSVSQISEGGARRVPTFSFVLSCDLDLPVQLSVESLVGTLPAYQEAADLCRATVRPSALLVEAVLADRYDTFGVPLRTHYAEASFSGCVWDSSLSFCVRYRDLDQTAQVAFTVWEIREGQPRRALAGTTLRLFSKKGRLKTGTQMLKLWLPGPADHGWPSRTPGKMPLAQRGEQGRIQQVLKRYERGELTPIPWLDKLTLRAIDEIAFTGDGGLDHPSHSGQATDGLLHRLALIVGLPSFQQAVLYQAAAMPALTGAGPETAADGGMTGREKIATTPTNSADGPPSTRSSSLHPWPLIVDPELGRENPSELKARKLARSHTRGLVDPGAKPGAEERRVIDAALEAPAQRPLSDAEQSLLWRYRYSLRSEPRALTKFLRCVDWADGEEAAQAAGLMASWERVGVADALELLSPDFTNEDVRGYAVSVLEGTTNDDELLDFLLQLVQSLRYEPADDSRLGQFLADRAKRNFRLASALFWYLCTELEDPEFGRRAAFVQGAVLDGLDPEAENGIAEQLDLAARLRHVTDTVRAAGGSAARKTDTLRALLAPGGACADLARLNCPNPLDPDQTLLGLDPTACAVFKSALSPLRLVFCVRSGDANRTQESGGGAKDATGGVATSAKDAGGVPTSAASSSSLAANRYAPENASTAPERTPRTSDASSIGGTLAPPIDPSTDTRHHPSPHARRISILYKSGDDLRQDQLVVQMIALMDGLLRRENLDLRVVQYRVLPTSTRDGMIQFVPSTALASLLRTHRTIHRFLAQFAPDPRGPYGLSPAVLTNFVKSCAAYCVFTYILGVGDRHLDNLLLTNDGRLFHIDFGFILGRDPKPFPPPVKLCREMVDALGGADSEHYRRFASHACEAYNCLRKSAGLLTGLIHLMAGSRLPDIAADPQAAVLKVQEKLRLDLSDEEAARFMRGLLAESASALMPAIMETTHRWAQYWR